MQFTTEKTDSFVAARTVQSNAAATKTAPHSRGDRTLGEQLRLDSSEARLRKFSTYTLYIYTFCNVYQSVDTVHTRNTF